MPATGCCHKPDAPGTLVIPVLLSRQMASIASSISTMKFGDQLSAVSVIWLRRMVDQKCRMDCWTSLRRTASSRPVTVSRPKEGKMYMPRNCSLALYEAHRAPRVRCYDFADSSLSRGNTMWATDAQKKHRNSAGKPGTRTRTVVIPALETCSSIR